MNFICSLIVVEDIQKSKVLYESILKQKIISDFGENVAFEGFALHKRSHFKQLIGNRKIMSGANHFELYFEDDNLEKIQEELKKYGFDFVHEITEQPWKQRVFRFYDYDRNIIEIGESMPHVAFRLSREKISVEEISRITYLPENIVKASIKEYERRDRRF